MKKNLKKAFISFIFILSAIAILNIPTTTRQGVNGELRVFSIPLYIKITEFIDRDYWYKKLTAEITSNCRTDEEKVRAIFDWVVANIHKVPAGFDVFDDHTNNIIIRRYGTGDQKADLFTTLCLYAGFEAFFRDEFPPNMKTNPVTCSYVLVNGKWRVLDVNRGLLFQNNTGEIATVKDIISDPSIITRSGAEFRNKYYVEIMKSLKPIKKDFVSKAEQQMPLLRLKYEIRRLLKRLVQFK